MLLLFNTQCVEQWKWEMSHKKYWQNLTLAANKQSWFDILQCQVDLHKLYEKETHWFHVLNVNGPRFPFEDRNLLHSSHYWQYPVKASIFCSPSTSPFLSYPTITCWYQLQNGCCSASTVIPQWLRVTLNGGSGECSMCLSSADCVKKAPTSRPLWQYG